ncbi:hypothetical protein IWQ56_006900, partial [Coemansia nantahalensis]
YDNTLVFDSDTDVGRMAAAMDDLPFGGDARTRPLPAAPRQAVRLAAAHHRRRGSLTDEEQAMAEREYVVIEKRAVEMNVMADEFESSPRTPLAFYPPRAGAIHQAPGVARQMSALARAVHDAVSPQYNISPEAADGPLNAPGAAAAAAADRAARAASGVFNPLDVALAETFESRHSQGTALEDPTIRRMEGLAYKAFAMSYLADLKWRMLPAAPASPDPLVDPVAGFLGPDDVTIEAAFVLYLRALSLLHRAMGEASRHWAGLHAGVSDETPAGVGLRPPPPPPPPSGKGAAGEPAVTVSAAFNGAVQWVRTKFN